QTLKRKGLGLESHELELDEGLDPGEKARRLSEGMDLSVARPRFYVTYGSSPPAAEGSLGSASSSPQGQGHPPAFKPAAPKPPGRSPGPLPPGISYPFFPAGSLNRALATKTPPPLYLGAEGRRGEAHGSLASGRSGGSTAVSAVEGTPALRNLLPGAGMWGQCYRGGGPALAWPRCRDVSPACETKAPPNLLASLSEASRAPGDLQPRDDYAKGYPSPLGPPRPLAEKQRAPVPPRRAQAMDAWQR
ncbi:MEF2B factor, partial [Scopus umbretta]|nr:MEF2B factor [Scopus umbretta]